MGFGRILIANRGEIAIRIARAARDLGIESVSVYSDDDSESLHVMSADISCCLEGAGVAAYLNGQGVVDAARESGCDAIHPGYGFLSENAGFSRLCSENGITFIGPDVDHLELFGDKGRARKAAVDAGVPVLRGIDRAITLEEAEEFFDSVEDGSGVMLKAVAGGGGRGSRAVTEKKDLERSFRRCKSEAKNAFGNDEIYVEEFIPKARHIEVQVVSDRKGGVTHLWDRECSVQRRFQKVVEIAPVPNLSDDIRKKIIDASISLARHVGYSNIGTFEFLVRVSESNEAGSFAFIETNARLQVEHTVTEVVTGVDVVQTQIQLAEGESLSAIGLDSQEMINTRGFAIQTRVNMETLSPSGNLRPSGGMLISYDPPTGPGVRTDGFGYSGYTTNSLFDSLLAKVIAYSPSPQFERAVGKSLSSLSEFRIEGVDTNIGFLKNVLNHPDFMDGSVHTRWVDENLKTLAVVDESDEDRRWVETTLQSQVESQSSPLTGTAPAQGDAGDARAFKERSMAAAVTFAILSKQHNN